MINTMIMKMITRDEDGDVYVKEEEKKVEHKHCHSPKHRTVFLSGAEFYELEG